MATRKRGLSAQQIHDLLAASDDDDSDSFVDSDEEDPDNSSSGVDGDDTDGSDETLYYLDDDDFAWSATATARARLPFTGTSGMQKVVADKNICLVNKQNK